MAIFEDIDIKDQLSRLSVKTRNGGALLVSEANKILKKDLFTEKKILENLVKYNHSFAVIDEENVDPKLVFSAEEIKQICIHYRLKFLDIKSFNESIPYEAILKIKYLNGEFDKELNGLKILAPLESFAKKNISTGGLLFVKTNYDNHFMIHQWGDKLQWYRKFRYWHMRHFENLFVTIIFCTLLIAIALPIELITLDRTAAYWSGYRAAAFFHLLIFNMGVAVFITFAFTKNFSSAIWNRQHDYE